MQFNELGLHPDILKAIAEAGYETPTPIQAQAIPHVMAGLDVMGAAQTGTGKTAAFTLPILHRLMPFASTSVSPARHPIRALMLAPTRELADQIYQNVAQYAKHTPLRSAVVFGGVDMKPQTAEMMKGVEVLIATPGRLLDHVQQKSVNLSQVSVLVLDEADRMLDMGFLPDLQRIVNLLPKDRQSLLFSATFSTEIRKLGKTFLKDNPISVETARRNATSENITQLLYQLDRSDQKRAAVVRLVKNLELSSVIVFTNTKIGAGRLARELIREGISADAIHGDKSQGERLAVLEKFKKGEVAVLVATDVAARGLDIAELPAVINFDVPYSPEDYVHRIGRTGRAGASGQAIMLMTADEERLVSDIEKLVSRKFERAVLPGGPIEGRAHGHGEGSAPRSGSREGRGTGARSDRPERSDRSDRSERGGERGQGRYTRGLDDQGVDRVVASTKARALDPFFTQPYDDSPPAAPATSGTDTAAASAEPAALAKPSGNIIRRKAGGVPALLGGLPKPKV
ncbi:MAG: DEAD/DEAH box helicase [Burkholderiaceae bacterium]